MKELQEILHRLDFLAPDESAILATVVDIKGSGYRLAGARMLIDENGHSIGGVSGGCLESDVLERAKTVLLTGKPTIVVYDSTRDENSVFGLQMGCRGIVRILLEPADNERLFIYLRTALVERKPSASATLIAATTTDSISIGSRFYWSDGIQDNGQFDDSVSDIMPSLIRDITDSISESRSRTKIYSTKHSELEFFIEVIEPPPSVLIFGAGNDAVPLAAFAKQLGWLVSVVDRRPAFATKERFPEADNVVVGHAEDLEDQIFADENSMAVVMTHHFDSDREIVRRLASSRFRYIGILGPKQRTADLLKELSDSGTVIDRKILDRIYAPVGLDIGASSPEGIALSIIAEIQSILADRDGGFLKNRTKPIYDR